MFVKWAKKTVRAGILFRAIYVLCCSDCGCMTAAMALFFRPFNSINYSAIVTDLQSIPYCASWLKGRHWQIWCPQLFGSGTPISSVGLSLLFSGAISQLCDGKFSKKVQTKSSNRQPTIAGYCVDSVLLFISILNIQHSSLTWWSYHILSYNFISSLCFFPRLAVGQTWLFISPLRAQRKRLKSTSKALAQFGVRYIARLVFEFILLIFSLASSKCTGISRFMQILSWIKHRFVIDFQPDSTNWIDGKSYLFHFFPNYLD